MVCGYIDDGYTLGGFAKESPGIYPEVRFEYRPAPSEETLPHFDGYKDLSPKEQLARTASMLARHLVKWDLKDPHGRTPNCRDAATMRKLPLGLFYRLEQIVTGLVPSDEDPQAKSPSDAEGFADKSPEGNLSAG
jgi:hypothetical protein